MLSPPFTQFRACAVYSTVIFFTSSVHVQFTIQAVLRMRSLLSHHFMKVLHKHSPLFKQFLHMRSLFSCHFMKVLHMRSLFSRHFMKVLHMRSLFSRHFVKSSAHAQFVRMPYYCMTDSAHEQFVQRPFFAGSAQCAHVCYLERVAILQVLRIRNSVRQFSHFQVFCTCADYLATFILLILYCTYSVRLI